MIKQTICCDLCGKTDESQRVSDAHDHPWELAVRRAKESLWVMHVCPDCYDKPIRSLFGCAEQPLKETRNSKK